MKSKVSHFERQRRQIQKGLRKDSDGEIVVFKKVSVRGVKGYKIISLQNKGQMK